MSLFSKSNTDAKPPCEGASCEGPPCHGNECDGDAVVALDWQALSIRFDNAVFAADFDDWIENDLAALEGRLSHFASSTNSPRRSR